MMTTIQNFFKSLFTSVQKIVVGHNLEDDALGLPTQRNQYYT